MFLELLLERNPAFVEAAIALHRDGRIPSNSYVVDLDTVTRNARAIGAAAAQRNLTVFAMTKQVGRVPPFIEAIRDGGIDACVAVDVADARAVHAAGARLGHVGHLVQVPQGDAAEVAGMAPDYWTVFSDDKAREAAAASAARGREQALLARLYADGDRFYRGHGGGFAAEDVVAVAERLSQLEGARFAGITTFPAALIDHDARRVVATPNLATLERAADRLRSAGHDRLEVNAAGTTSTAMLDLLADAGATQIEPGHGLTGTTPLHVYDRTLPERPAVLYLTEVSHQHAGEAYCFGGGMYIDPVFGDYATQALVASGPTSDAAGLLPIELPPPAAIDYYGMIDTGRRTVSTGDTVILGFRIQAFVTRASVTSIAGVAAGRPEVVGIHDTSGRPITWPA